MSNNKRVILVTDGAQGKIIYQEHRSASHDILHDLKQDLKTTGENDAGKPGRSFESAASGHHSYEPKTDWHEHQKELFVKSLVELFIKEHQNHKFSVGYVICPPKLIQHARSLIHPYVHKLPESEKLIIHEMTKDLTHLKTHELVEVIER